MRERSAALSYKLLVTSYKQEEEQKAGRGVASGGRLVSEKSSCQELATKRSAALSCKLLVASKRKSCKRLLPLVTNNLQLTPCNQSNNL